MWLVIYESAGQDKHQNQIMANINYNPNAMSIFKKTQEKKTKSDKTWTHEIKLYFIR